MVDDYKSSAIANISRIRDSQHKCDYICFTRIDPHDFDAHGNDSYWIKLPQGFINNSLNPNWEQWKKNFHSLINSEGLNKYNEAHGIVEAKEVVKPSNEQIQLISYQIKYNDMARLVELLGISLLDTFNDSFEQGIDIRRGPIINMWNKEITYEGVRTISDFHFPNKPDNRI